MHGNHQPLIEQGGAGYSRFVNRPRQHQVADALLELFVQRRRFALQHMELGPVAEGAAELLHGGGQVMGAHRGYCPHIDRSGKAAVAAVYLGHAAIDAGKPFRNVAEEHPAIIGELYVAAHLAKQRAAQLAFQRGNGVRKGRLRNMQALGRARVMLGFGQMAEIG